MKRKLKKPAQPSAFTPYEVGDWIIPRARDRNRFPMYKCEGFSGNYVYARPFEFGSQPLRLLKAEFTKASQEDVAKSVAWRLKGRP